MSDADVQEAYRQAYAALRVLERHGERCVLLRRSELEADMHELEAKSNLCMALAEERPEYKQSCQGQSSGYYAAAQRIALRLREADEEAERYGC